MKRYFILLAISVISFVSFSSVTVTNEFQDIPYETTVQDLFDVGTPIIADIATNAAVSVVDENAYPIGSGNADHTSITNMEAYLSGQNIRVSVTNYYGNSSGVLPRLRIQEYRTITNSVGGVDTVTTEWVNVWDEVDKYEEFRTNTLSDVGVMTNGMSTYVNTSIIGFGQVMTNELNNKSPLAWGSVSSAGGVTPADTVWMTHGKTVFAGGSEFQAIAVPSGQLYVLVSKGTGTYSQGNPGTFRFTTDDNQFFFGMRIEDSYLLGCNTDGITVTPAAGGNLITLDYNVTMIGKPILYYKQAITNELWEQLNDSTGTPIPGASVTVTWEAAPPAAHEYAYISIPLTINTGFFCAYIETAGKQQFETNLPIDAQGGYLATNLMYHTMEAIEPYIDTDGTTVKWRRKTP